MNSAIGAAFGGLVAVILLLLFSASTFYMVSSVISFCASTNPCVSPPAGLVGEGFVYVVTTVAGLVSALVIAQLSITEPGKPPTLGSFRPEGAPQRWSRASLPSISWRGSRPALRLWSSA